MYNFTVLYTCRYIYLFIFFIIINCDMSHVLEINYLILSYLIHKLTCSNAHIDNTTQYKNDKKQIDYSYIKSVWYRIIELLKYV